MVLKFTKEDIIQGFTHSYSLNDSRTNFGIIECLGMLNSFINKQLKDCKSYTESRTLAFDMNMMKIDEIVCCAIKEEDDERLKLFLLSLKESKDFSRIIFTYLLEDYNSDLFHQEIQKSLEYHQLKTDILIEPKIEKTIRKTKI